MKKKKSVVKRLIYPFSLSFCPPYFPSSVLVIRLLSLCLCSAFVMSFFFYFSLSSYLLPPHLPRYFFLIVSTFIFVHSHLLILLFLLFPLFHVWPSRFPTSLVRVVLLPFRLLGPDYHSSAVHNADGTQEHLTHKAIILYRMSDCNLLTLDT